MVQIRRRYRAAGRQSVRDRDRQGVDGGAGDRSRRAERNPRARGRGRAGRRRCRRHRRRGRRDRRADEVRAGGPRLARRCRAGDGASRCGGRAADQARSVLRGAHAGAQFRPGAARRRRHGRRRWRAGSRAKPASISSRMRGSGPHGRIVARDLANAPRLGAGRAARRAGAWPDRRSSQVALRSGELRRDAARRHAPHHRGPASASETNHPAFLSHRRYRDRSPQGSSARTRTRQRPRTATAIRRSSSRSTIS